MEAERLKIKKVVFFGSSMFSLKSLERLIELDKNNLIKLVGIVTSEDKLANRGYKLTPNPVAKFSVENDYEDILIKIKTLKNEINIKKLQDLNFDVGVVVSFGYIIPENVISLAKFGMINLHPGNLPYYRGAAPIQRTLENGDSFLDVNIINLTFELDAGEVLNKKTINILPSTTAREFIPFLAEEGSYILKETLLNLEDCLKNKLDQVGQISYAKKINSLELKLNFEEDCELICRKIKAFNMDGCCYFLYKGLRIKIIDSNFQRLIHSENLGEIKDKRIYCKNGYLEPIKIQKEGKKEILWKDSEFCI